MSSVTTPPHTSAELPLPMRIPPLGNGDRLKLDEYWRRAAATPAKIRAQLIEGVVYLTGAPVSFDGHSGPHALLITWLGVYASRHSEVRVGDNPTLLLDDDNAPQPDACLLKVPGQTKIVNDFIQGAPEFVAEIAAGSAGYDLHDKFDAYQRNGVREYLVLRTWDSELDWFVLRDGAYQAQSPPADGIYRSEQFPGLWLNAAALLAGDFAAVLRTLHHGMSAAGG